jgi:hypothetical protein
MRLKESITKSILIMNLVVMILERSFVTLPLRSFRGNAAGHPRRFLDYGSHIWTCRRSPKFVPIKYLGNYKATIRSFS